MSDKTVAEKAKIKPGTKIALLEPVAPGVVESLGLPEGVRFVEAAEAQLVFLFVRNRAELDARMPPAVAALGAGSTIWVFFRKGARAVGLDMTRNDVWTIAEGAGLRPLGLVSVDDTWTAFRLRRNA